LITALGGEGGGVLMNWIVAAARNSGHTVQATSVPGVAQRTGSTSYYIEIASAKDAVLSLVPMPGRVDVVVSSELVETARVLAAGFVSERTTLVSSTSRLLTTAEKISMADGRYSQDAVAETAQAMAGNCYLLDLSKLAADNNTYISATLFGALAGCEVLPWPIEQSQSVLADSASRAGFDAAHSEVEQLRSHGGRAQQSSVSVPQSLQKVIEYGVERCSDYQDHDYAGLYQNRCDRLIDAGDLQDEATLSVLTEACRRLALWMCYEDIARVADLKTRPERFQRIRDEVRLQPGQLLNVTEYLKPRAEEIADVLPQRIGAALLARVQRGGWIPFLGKGRRISSNGVFGYWLLRATAQLKRLRRRSYRFAEENQAIDHWLDAMVVALPRSVEFATALAELPRVLKGYSDTLLRGKSAYRRIIDTIVDDAIAQQREDELAPALRDALQAALADETHGQLKQSLNAVPISFQSKLSH
jgi:indolepyruvate ferredoxin oxidoreductase beta subunit